MELGLPPGRDQDGRLRNNMLPAEAVARDRSLNFLSSEVASYAEERAPVVLGEEGALDEDRLWRNLLSSMPLCFNLFGRLRAAPESGARVLASATGLDVAKIDELEVEWTPDGGHPLGDRTAFDAWVAYRDSYDNRGFFAVETKYTEPFSRGVYDRPRYREVTAWPDAGFLPGAAEMLRGTATNQLWRNTLLAAAVRREGGFAEGRVLVVALGDDPHVARAMAVFRDAHEAPQTLVHVTTIEQLVAAAREEEPLAPWSESFERRYLDLSPVSASPLDSPTPA
ncbi:MAG TPA: hypothetical protein DIU15_17170 [Deltaproteobacteria bacterium]|nr:hypothetical protein [Deltaproteobacteria bacterium]HCP47775.1 hypothetical protein [Deltaproteobacteria bacterium]